MAIFTGVVHNAGAALQNRVHHYHFKLFSQTPFAAKIRPSAPWELLQPCLAIDV
jgi:hypothetical protein